MSRSWSFYGLTPQAHLFLEQHIELCEYQETLIRTYANGRCEQSTQTLKESSWQKGKIYAQHQPWFDEPLQLKSWTLPNGQEIYEFVQDEPWSGGPCTFLALSYDISGTQPVIESLWSEETIKEYIGECS